MKRKIAALVAASLFTTQALAAVTLDLSVDGRVGYKFNDRGHAWIGATAQKAGDYNNTIIGVGFKLDF